MLERSISVAEKKLSIFRRKCKDLDWYYSIDEVTDVIQDSLIRIPKQNTIRTFFTILDALEPKFMDELRYNFGQRMRISIMLGQD
jgi:hypothetical protein